MGAGKNKFTRGNLDQTVELIFAFIVDYIQKEGYPPSIREIGLGVGIKSTSTIYAHLQRLQDMGRIEYTPGKRRAILVPDLQQANVNNLPIIGMVTAGQPILAVENIEGTLPFSQDYFKGGDHFVLKIRGDSMVEGHILDGDYVVVRKQSSASLGQIIVARIGDEATVKRLIMLDEKVYLKPENPAYSLIEFDSEDCQIVGLVVGLFRSGI